MGVSRCEVVARLLTPSVNTMGVVNTVGGGVNMGRGCDRHREGYMREYMRKRRGGAGTA